MIHPREAPSTPPRFFGGEAPHTIHDVMRAKLEVESLALDSDPSSPTPLDPYRTRVKGGRRYEERAREHMDDMLHRITTPTFSTAEEIHEWMVGQGQLRVSRGTAESAAGEILAQHESKQARNDSALELLRAGTTEIDAQTAEEIMQVRAGVASLSTLLRFLARFPQVGGLELMKLTRPFDPRAIESGRAQFISSLMKLNGPGIAVDVNPRADYYRRIEIDDKSIVVLKTHVARVAIRGIPELDVIVRDAGVILNPQRDDPMMAYRTATKRDGSKVYVAPIGLTGYGRTSMSAATGDNV